MHRPYVHDMFEHTQATPSFGSVITVCPMCGSLCGVFCQLKTNPFTQCVSALAVHFFPSTALPKEYQRIGKAFQNLATVFNSSGYQGTYALCAHHHRTSWLSSRGSLFVLKPVCTPTLLRNAVTTIF